MLCVRCPRPPSLMPIRYYQLSCIVDVYDESRACAVRVGQWARGPWGGLAVALAGVFIVSVTLAASWRAIRATSEDQQPGESWAHSVGLTQWAPGKRPTAPAVVATTQDGQSLALAGLRGHVVVLNVWGSWCAPCRDEAPDLAAVALQTRGSGVRFVGLDVRDSPTAARAFEQRYGITYPSWDDRDAKLLAQFSGIVPIDAVPSTLVLDQNGALAARIIGRIRPDALRAVIAALTKTDPANAQTGAK